MTNSNSALLAYSGGLDTSYLVAWLTNEKGYEVTTLTVDCGGFDGEAKLELEARALGFGAKKYLCVDARSMLFERVLKWLIAGNVRRGGTYPLCVAAERGLQAEVLAATAAELSIGIVAHGCTGAGNDQIRFEATLAIVADDLDVLAPVRDHAVSREEEREYLEQHDLPLPPAGGGSIRSTPVFGASPSVAARCTLANSRCPRTRGSGRGARRAKVLSRSAFAMACRF